MIEMKHVNEAYKWGYNDAIEDIKVGKWYRGKDSLEQLASEYCERVAKPYNLKGETK